MKWSAQKEKLDSGAEFFNSFIAFRHTRQARRKTWGMSVRFMASSRAISRSAARAERPQEVEQY
jgi:hypothetical protein